MTRILATTPGLVLAIVCCAAGPAPSRSGDADPQQPKIVYHRFKIIFTGDKPEHTLETMRKFLRPLDVVQMKTHVVRARPSERAMGAGVSWYKYMIYIRSDQTYERVLAVLQRKSGIYQVCEVPVALGSDRLHVSATDNQGSDSWQWQARAAKKGEGAARHRDAESPLRRYGASPASVRLMVFAWSHASSPPPRHFGERRTHDSTPCDHTGAYSRHRLLRGRSCSVAASQCRSPAAQDRLPPLQDYPRWRKAPAHAGDHAEILGASGCRANGYSGGPSASKATGDGSRSNSVQILHVHPLGADLRASPG